MGATAAQRGYHHGDLRNALILAAADLIEDRGSLDFSMAEAARQAGVSCAAPYRHFRNKDDLLQAVAQLCFIGLSEAAREAVAGQETGTVEAIIAIGHSYIRFMLSHSSFQDLMWGDMGKRAMDDENVDLRGSGFYVLADAVTALCEKERLGPLDTVEISTELWSMVHGLSGLAMGGKVDRFLPDADIFQLLERSTHIFFDGLRHRSSA